MACRLRWFGAALAGWCVLAGTLPVFGGESQWVEVKSPNFSVMTDGGEKRGRAVAVRFEQMRAVFGSLLLKASVNLAVPLQIVAFRNTKELRQFAPLWNGKPVQVAGLFQGTTDRSFILLDLSVDNPWEVMFHEYAHQLMNSNLSAQTAPWFEEGFAEYFRTIEVDEKEARVGKVPDDTYRVLQQTGLAKTADLFRVQQNSGTYNENGDRRTGFYAQSSIVVHYLYDHNLVPMLGAYFDLTLRQKVGVEDAIQRSFGMSAAQFDQEIRNYVSHERYKLYKLPTPARIATTSYVVTPLSATDGNAVLADVHLHSPNYGAKAVEELEAILKTDPSNASALRGLGYACLLKHDFEQAAKYFQKAVEENSKDPRVHYYVALLMSREKTLGEVENVPVMTNELETSIALDPNFADAYSLLAFAFAYGGDPERGLAMMRKAVALSPRNDMYVFYLAQMYMNNKKLAEAIALLQGLQSSPQPILVSRAGQMLEEAQEMKQANDSGETVVMNGTVRAAAEQPADPQEQPKSAENGQVGVITLTAPTSPRLVKGKIVSVDCRAVPGAMLSLATEGKTLKLDVDDTKHVLVIGADAFSCAGSNHGVAANHWETGEGTGEVVSVEVQ
jgi:Flp pilus assembly protein TadD